MSEMRYYLFTQYECGDNARSIALDVIIFCICTICVCTQRVFDGVTLPECVGRNSCGKRAYFLSFGAPPAGSNRGNTPARTFSVLKILQKAMESTQYHQDGGWKCALNVRVFMYVCVYVYMYVLCHVCMNACMGMGMYEGMGIGMYDRHGHGHRHRHGHGHGHGN